MKKFMSEYPSLSNHWKLALIATTLSASTHSSSQIVNIEELRITATKDTIHWYGNARMGATLTKIKDQILQINASAQIEYKKRKNLFLLLLDARFLRAARQNFNNAGFAHLRYNHKITELLTWEAYLQSQYNRLLLIRSRHLAGTGPRYRIYKDVSGKNRIYAGLSWLYEFNRFLNNFESRHWHRLSTYVSFTVQSKTGVKLAATTYFQPLINQFSNHRFSSEWRIDVPLSKKLSFMSDYALGLDNSLPEEAPFSNYTWINGLTFKF